MCIIMCIGGVPLQMESASQHDFLTGLPNRSKFMKDLEQMIDAKVPCTV